MSTTQNNTTQDKGSPAWLDIECPGCGNVWYCQSDNLLECDDCGTKVWIPLTYTRSFIEPTTT